MAERILRLTRHAEQPAQLADLQRIFGEDLEIVQVPKTVADAAEVKALVTEHTASVLEAVLPLPILADVVNPRNGVAVPVIRAITVRTPRLNDESEQVMDERGEPLFDFVFDHYEKW